jgi:hypothetical protein
VSSGSIFVSGLEAMASTGELISELEGKTSSWSLEQDRQVILAYSISKSTMNSLPLLLLSLSCLNLCACFPRLSLRFILSLFRKLLNALKAFSTTLVAKTQKVENEMSDLCYASQDTKV